MAHGQHLEIQVRVGMLASFGFGEEQALLLPWRCVCVYGVVWEYCAGWSFSQSSHSETLHQHWEWGGHSPDLRDQEHAIAMALGLAAVSVLDS